MTQRDPDKRTSVRNYRHVLEGRRDPATLVSYSLSNTSNNNTNTTISDNNTNTTTATATTTANLLPPFPQYFSRTVHPIFHTLHIHGTTPDDRIAIICHVSTHIYSIFTLITILSCICVVIYKFRTTNKLLMG